MTLDPWRATILKTAAALCRGNFTPDEEDASGALLDRLHEASKVAGIALKEALDAVDAEVDRLRLLVLEAFDAATCAASTRLDDDPDAAHQAVRAARATIEGLLR